MSTRCYPVDGSPHFDADDAAVAGYKQDHSGLFGFAPQELTVGSVASRKTSTSTFMVNGTECRIETLEDKITRLEGGG